MTKYKEMNDGRRRQPAVNSIGDSYQSPRLPSHREQVRFELRRLHNLLRFAEAARNPTEHASASAAVLRALRRHLAEFYGLHGQVEAAESIKTNQEGIL